MGVAFEIKAEVAGASAGFAALRKVGADLAPVLADIGAEIETTTLERFETNRAPDGSAWKQSLHSKTTGMPTLVEKGHLRDSVHYRLDGEQAVEIGAGGIASAYAAIHQVGGTISAKAGGALKFRLATGQFINAKSVKIPARPYLGLSADDRRTIPEIVGEHWARAVAGGAYS